MIVADTMASVAQEKWHAFVSTLHLDERVEFGEGDVGLPGGIQLLEPASANVTSVEMIKRFGGSTASTAQWPEDVGHDEDDRFERLEKLMEKAMKRMTSSSKRGAKNSGSHMGSSFQ